MKRLSYPFLVESEGFRYAGYWGIAIFLVLTGLFWKFGRPAWMYLQDVSKHPVVKRVEQWSDPLGASVEAERELKNSVFHKSDGIFITDNYVVRKRFFTFNIFPISDLLWAYKKVTRHYTNFIPTGKSFGAILIFYGGGEAFGGKERRVDELLAFVSTKAPWAIVGFSPEIKEVFERRTSEFCQAVEARRQELSQKR